MPTAALRPCVAGCGTLVTTGACPSCARKTEQARGSAHQRGYTVTWNRFRAYVVQRMVHLNISPVCGATLPGGPDTQAYSRCQAEGLRTLQDLHLDHDPPLQDWERTDPRKVCDEARVGLLCRSCHAAKTRGEQLGTTVSSTDRCEG